MEYINWTSLSNVAETLYDCEPLDSSLKSMVKALDLHECLLLGSTWNESTFFDFHTFSPVLGS